MNDDEIKRRLAALPIHSAPAPLIASLKKTYLTPSLGEKIREFFRFTPVWKPAGVFTVVVLLTGVWFIGKNKTAEEDSLSLEPLLAAHSRYQAENLVPSGDMVASNFSAQLAVYYGEND